MPYDRFSPLFGIPAARLIEGSHFECDPHQIATNGRVTSAELRRFNRMRRDEE